MNEIWAIAMGERVLWSTISDSRDSAWFAFLYISPTSVLGYRDWIEQQQRRGYSAVRLKYEIVERDGEEING